MLLSLVIPVYKVEKYVKGTLLSIFDQGVDESLFEVVVVDNGTPDNSMAIVQEVIQGHSNVKIVKIDVNRGLSRGRNAGFETAQGDFVWHIDSDDKISPNSLSSVIDLIGKHPAVDLFGFDIIKVKEQDGTELLSTILPSVFRSRYNQEVANTEVCPYLQGPVQRFVFKRSFVIDNHLSFIPDLQHEDMEYLPKAYYHARKVLISDIPVYRYLLRYTGSLTSSLSPLSYPDRIRIITMLKSYKQPDKRFASSNRMLDLFCFWIAFYLLSPDKYTTEHFPDFKRFISEHHKTIRQAAKNGIPALWHFHEMKRLPLALLLWTYPLAVYRIYFKQWH